MVIVVIMSVRLVWYDVCSRSHFLFLLVVFPSFLLFFIHCLHFQCLILSCSILFVNYIPILLASFTSRSLPFTIQRLWSSCKISWIICRTTKRPPISRWVISMHILSICHYRKYKWCSCWALCGLYGAWKVVLKPELDSKIYEARGFHIYDIYVYNLWQAIPVAAYKHKQD